MVEDENIKNPSGLSEFFNVLSKEKNDVRQKIKEKIDDPKSGLSGLFNQLEEALQETKKVSVEEVSVEEVSENTGRPEGTGLSPEDQNKLDVFSNLLNSFGSDKEIPAFVEELEPEELIPEELVVESEEPQDITEPQNDIITSVIRNLDDMSRKTQVKEEVDQISSIRKEFDNFRSFISQQIGSLQMSGAGSGETRLEFLDDVDRATAKVDGKALVYDSGDGKWKGETILTAADIAEPSDEPLEGLGRVSEDTLIEKLLHYLGGSDRGVVVEAKDGSVLGVATARGVVKALAVGSGSDTSSVKI